MSADLLFLMIGAAALGAAYAAWHHALSDGFERSQGFIVLAGARLQSVGLAGQPT